MKKVEGLSRENEAFGDEDDIPEEEDQFTDTDKEE